ncbi:hypothetical protein IFR05_003883 [Cadophora sp. M221]|nr:hypothetical protein IFR05_003883 [Cadophora sp. M221]
MSASHWLSYELDSVQTLSQSAPSSHHHRLSLQRAPETERPWTRPALVAAKQPVAEMAQDDAAWLLPSSAPGAAAGSYETLAGAFLGGSANGTAPVAAAGLAAETLDDRKDLECASLLEAFGRTERAISEVMHPLLVRRSSLLPAQLFTASPTVER